MNNMREIKFRIWFKNWEGIGKGGFNFPTKDDFDYYAITLTGKVCRPVEGYDRGSAELSLENQDEYILNQYTGLKDKNGQEIYEGDIIDFNGYHREVRWSDSTASFLPVTQDEAETESIVVGNIYENPELLNQK